MVKENGLNRLRTVLTIIGSSLAILGIIGGILLNAFTLSEDDINKMIKVKLMEFELKLRKEMIDELKDIKKRMGD